MYEATKANIDVVQRYVHEANGTKSNGTIIHQMVEDFFPDTTEEMRRRIFDFAAGVGAGSVFIVTNGEMRSKSK